MSTTVTRPIRPGTPCVCGHTVEMHLRQADPWRPADWPARWGRCDAHAAYDSPVVCGCMQFRKVR